MVKILPFVHIPSYFGRFCLKTTTAINHGIQSWSNYLTFDFSDEDFPFEGVLVGTRTVCKSGHVCSGKMQIGSFCAYNELCAALRARLMNELGDETRMNTVYPAKGGREIVGSLTT